MFSFECMTLIHFWYFSLLFLKNLWFCVGIDSWFNFMYFTIYFTIVKVKDNTVMYYFIFNMIFNYYFHSLILRKNVLNVFRMSCFWVTIIFARDHYRRQFYSWHELCLYGLTLESATLTKTYHSIASSYKNGCYAASAYCCIP